MVDLPERWTERLLQGSPGLRAHPQGRTMAAVASAALAAVDPRACVLRSTHRLHKPKGEAAVVGEFVWDLAPLGTPAGPRELASMFVFGAGKASAAMAAALVEQFGERVVGGVVIVKHTPVGVTLSEREPGDPEQLVGRIGPIELILGDHPIPGPRTAAAVARLREVAARVGARDLVLCPISGGASALLSEPTLAAESWAELHRWWLAHDISIQAINRIRRRFDALKAGGLARLFAPATVAGLIMSDVIGDELALIGSGPTVYASANEDAEYRAVLAELDAMHPALAPELRALLANPAPLADHPQTPDGQPQGVFQVLLARNGDAREAACHAAQAAGLDSLVLLPALGGLARDEGQRLGHLLPRLPGDLPIELPACVVTGGETTVSLAAAPTGLGGRNQELALAAVDALAGDPDVALLSLATDGEDGPTDAAGALVTGASAALARDLGLDVAKALAEHSSYALLDRLGALIRTGPTGTNVCDLALLFHFRGSP